MAETESSRQFPCSILDTDLYKLTMQNAVFKQFNKSSSVYRFTNREPSMLFNRKTAEWIQVRVLDLQNLRLTAEERSWLSTKCAYFDETYLDFLANLSLDPASQVEVKFVPKEEQMEEERPEDMGLIEIDVRGPWRECILYEVPLMAIISEGYFLHTVPNDWNFDEESIRSTAADKAYRLLSSTQGCLAFSEFGTRRRRSYRVHKLVMEGLIEGDKRYRQEAKEKREEIKGGLVGTSNVHFAMQFDTKPVGTIAHEWIMAVGAKENYREPNGKAMELWESVYPAAANSPLHTMLTDTYTAPLFFREFASQPERALRWSGLRHDSGDPIEFARLAKRTWQEIIQASKNSEASLEGKKVIFSDGLDVDNALRIWKSCEEIGIDASFGIGTYFTNDFHLVNDTKTKSKPLNMVIKLRRVDDLECIKLSDDKGKWTGDYHEVLRSRDILGLGEEKVDQNVRAYGITG